MEEQLDALDIRILQVLQHDSRMTNKELADKIGKSVTTVYERIQSLEKRGVIRGYVALLDGEAIGKNLVAFTIVKVEKHSTVALRAFEREAIKLPEVMECYHLTGHVDFLLKVAIRDMKAYRSFVLEKLGTLPNIGGLETMFVLSEGKVETAYALEMPEGKKKDIAK
jgi:Lrp/AsnC family leucine-responsive transcriptional regulator